MGDWLLEKSSFRQGRGGGGVGVERRWLRIEGKYLVGSGLEMGVASRRDLGRF